MIRQSRAANNQSLARDMRLAGQEKLRQAQTLQQQLDRVMYGEPSGAGEFRSATETAADVPAKAIEVRKQIDQMFTEAEQLFKSARDLEGGAPAEGAGFRRQGEAVPEGPTTQRAKRRVGVRRKRGGKKAS
jgi:hypothetical protein